MMNICMHTRNLEEEERKLKMALDSSKLVFILKVRMRV